MYTSSGYMNNKVPETVLDYDEESRLLYDDDGDQQVAQEKKAWNMFRDIPTPKESGSMVSTAWIDTSVKILKVVAYILVFAVVLGAACVAKGCVLFITSQFQKGRQITHCNRGLVRDQQFITTHSLEERVTWLWAGVLVYAIPQLGIFLRSCRIRYFKSTTKPNMLQFAVPLFTETAHTFGIGGLMFFVLPSLDVVKGAMLMNAMCFVPGIVKALTRNRNIINDKNLYRYYLTLSCDILAVSAQATAFVVWPLLNGEKVLWWIPAACICISIGWWETFVEDSDKQTSDLARFRNSLKESRYYTYSIIPLWNIVVFMILLVSSLHYQGDDAFSFFTHTLEAFGERTYVVQEVQILVEDSYDGMIDFITSGNTLSIPAVWTSSLWVALIQVGAAYICYVGAKVACKILIQGFSFSLALTLVGPMLVNLLMVFCGMRTADPCAFHNTIPDYLFFNVPPVYFLRDYVGREMAWVWILWLMSQGWVCIHVWRPRCDRLASTDKLFTKPWYCGPLIDQCLLMNRTQDHEVEVAESGNDSEFDENGSSELPPEKVPQSLTDDANFADKISRIYVCATMWHETRDEIMEFLKSIFRLDKHQCARRIAFEAFNYFDPDYYELEAHIFMDDAFEVSDHSVEDLQVNRFVKCLVDTIDDALGEIYKEERSLRPPKKYPTPYGGRLVWTMPGRNKLICHLKDKSKIRHRKRWSQVMYMYYFLGHRLMDSNRSLQSLSLRAENTYLLALDGDIDFNPSAVMLLIDLMKKNKKVGAACGRIHPVGSGFMAWYQMFEYAIGHWLQKATEHQIGCVLCSPGCFSLFRGKALMEDNVMKRYTLTSNEARHYVQYDQGEDRWLCTLLLQRGYRVEYSAASDAYTHCPETFGEFFNQRRRWVPSTIANIFDLLGDFKRTVRVNDNISNIYIVYQMLLMAGTVLGPGTIFLMMIGAMNAITGISNAYALLLNLIPITIFIIVCMTCKSETQLFLANIITCAYAMVMMMVIVGIVLQIIEDGWLAPSSIFTVLTFGSFFITAVLHPQEIACLFYIVVYYITIPSMYMLLIIYSLCNLNNVSWGTRETVQKKTQAEIKAEEKAAEEAKKKVDNQSILRMFGKTEETQGSLECGVSGLFKCMCCVNPKDHKDEVHLLKIGHTLTDLDKKLDSLGAKSPAPVTASTSRHELPTLHEVDDDDDDREETITDSIREERDDLINPFWIEDPDLRKGEVDFLTTAESEFWKELIDTYLRPIDENKEELDRIKADLKTLRDTVVFAFVMLNAIFVLVIFLLQLNQDVLHLKWPLGQKNEITYDNDQNIVTIEIDYLMLEPIGSMFLVFFGSVLLIQFTAMMFHRLGTLMHLLSNVTLDWYCLKTPKELTKEELLNKDTVKMVEIMQEMNPDSKNTGLDETDITKRKTIMNLVTSRDTNQAADFNLETNFNRAIENNNDPQLVKRLTVMGVKAPRQSLAAMQNRRESVMEDRRRSQMQMPGRVSAANMFNASRPSVGFASHRRSTVHKSYAPADYDFEEEDIRESEPNLRRKSKVVFADHNTEL